MGKVNMGRVLMGGVLAGVVLFLLEYVLQGVVLKGQWDAAMRGLGKTEMSMGGPIMIYAVWSRIVGITSLWLYAAARPRFGAGVGTAARVGIAVWILGSLAPGLGMQAMGLFPSSLLYCASGGELVIFVVATVVGAWPYQEAA